MPKRAGLLDRVLVRDVDPAVPVGVAVDAKRVERSALLM